MIAILLSTYNGEAYLEAQLLSIISQTNTNWKLFIRDDGSIDKTHEIIKKYTAKFPNLIILITDEYGNLRSARSFMQLLQISQASYYMFCDQDDVWLPFKIQNSLNKMTELEKRR